MAQTLYYTRGLPGCGKSTEAKRLVDASNGTLKRVNRDSLRALLDNYDYTKRFNGKNEGFVTRMRDELMEQALAAGYSVINDDTNLSDGNAKHFEDMAKKWKVQSKCIDLRDTPLVTCIRQDLRRLESVGKDVIMKMWYQNICKPAAEANKAQHIKDIPDAYIFDIDGTLAHMDGIRGPFEEDKYDQDICDYAVQSVLFALTKWEIGEERLTKIIVLSGREGSSIGEAKTKAWLTDHAIYPDEFWMRKPGDHRDDTEVKLEIYNSKIKYRYNVVGVFDDRHKVCRMWEMQGLKVFNVGLPYDFDIAGR